MTRSRWFWGRSIFAFAFIFLTSTASADVQVYFNDFEGSGPAGTEWSNTSTDTTPGTASHPADKFLGQFGNQTVTLTLTGLPPEHTTISLSFDLYVIRSWDGNFSQQGDPRGPDYWAITEGIPADPNNPDDWDFVTTFSNWDPATGPNQAYPGTYDVGNYPARTNASENNTLGFTFDLGEGPFIQDAVYDFEIAPFSHTASQIQVTFGAANLQALSDESWGLDNVRVAVDVPEPATCLLLLFGAALGLKPSRFRI